MKLDTVKSPSIDWKKMPRRIRDLAVPSDRKAILLNLIKKDKTLTTVNRVALAAFFEYNMELSDTERFWLKRRLPKSGLEEVPQQFNAAALVKYNATLLRLGTSPRELASAFIRAHPEHTYLSECYRGMLEAGIPFVPIRMICELRRQAGLTPLAPPEPLY